MRYHRLILQGGGGWGEFFATAVTKGIPVALRVIVIGVFSWLKKRRGSRE
jgi:hypothetical protein